MRSSGGCSRFIACCLCLSYLLKGRAPHTLPCSSVGSLSWERVLHKLLQHESFPHGAVLQRGSSVGSQVLPSNLLQCGLLSFHGSTGPASSLLQHRLPMGSQPPSGIPMLWHGVFHRLQVEICSTVDLHGLQGHSLPHQCLLHSCRGISALVSGAPRHLLLH